MSSEATSEQATSEQASWHALSLDEALQRQASSLGGLFADEAARRLSRFGPNRLEAVAAVSVWELLLRQFRSVVVALLTGAAALAFALGDVAEAVAIFAVLAANVGLGFWSEWGAHRAMDALRKLQVQQAKVRRGGEEMIVDAADLVPGDLMVLEEGVAIPADGRLVESAELNTLEAPLTGEPFPVAKSPAPVADDEPLADRTCMVWKGTLVSTGHALAVVTGTGRDSEVGRISAQVEEAHAASGRTPLEQRLDQLGRRLVFITLVVAAVVTAVGVLRGGEVWLMVETGLALAIAAVPEGLPVVATITLAVGMHRMARRRALVRHLPAVETLGSTTVICTDKTGTLTAGTMTVVRLWLAGRADSHRDVEVNETGFRSGDEELRSDDPELTRALRVGTLANRATPDQGDPTEIALLGAAGKAGLDRRALVANRPEIAEVPFTSERRYMATFHRSEEEDDDEVLVCLKGAPTRLAELCTRLRSNEGDLAKDSPMDDDARRRVDEANRGMASRGLRVLALAEGRLAEGGLQEENPESSLGDPVFLGLVGVADPPAPDVRATIETLDAAGIRTVMVTGDQNVTAKAVAAELGLQREDDEVMDGRELSSLDVPQLAARLDRICAFSRVSPGEKLRIVEAYQQRREIVGMLGDGVNDAPALEKADIGVAMGGRGTDVAKETADMVLADDRFSTVAVAVEEGRVIYDNILKFIFYLFSCNVSEVLVLFLSVVAGLPLPVLPLQILWLNLVTDVFPALALAMEPAEDDVMKRPPRDPKTAILSRTFMTKIGLHAGLLTAVALGAFAWSLQLRGDSLDRARTIAFMTLAFSQLLHVLNARSDRAVLWTRRLLQNAWVWAAIGLTTSLQLLVLYVPALSRVFAATPLGASDWLLVGIASAVPLALGQLLRR